MGAFSFTNQVDVVLGKYTRLIKPGGKIFIGTTRNLGKVKLADGRIMYITEWVKSIPGMEVKIEGNINKVHNIEIQVRNGESPQIPKLKLFLSDDGTPPARLYIEESK